MGEGHVTNADRVPEVVACLGDQTEGGGGSGQAEAQDQAVFGVDRRTGLGEYFEERDTAEIGLAERRPRGALADLADPPPLTARLAGLRADCRAQRLAVPRGGFV